MNYLCNECGREFYSDEPNPICQHCGATESSLIEEPLNRLYDASGGQIEE